MPDALIIFVRNPVEGQVKTRLAESIGTADALRVYLILCEQLREITDGLSCAKFVFYSEHLDNADNWKPELYHKKAQSGNKLGDRMEAAFHDVLAEGYDKVLLIGSDVYGLASDHIQAAFRALDSTDLVFGPATDGGYYLIGMKKFTNVPFGLQKWSHSQVLDQTIQLVEQSGLTYKLVAPLSDIDTIDDLKKTALYRLL